MPDHSHDPSCYSDSKADVETEEHWGEMAGQLPDTCSLADKLVAMAESQLGYCESTKNFRVDKNGIRRGYSRYGDWYYTPYADWSSIFVSFCMHYVGIGSEEVPYNANAEMMRSHWVMMKLYWQQGIEAYERGDIVFLDMDHNNKADHVGIISRVGEEDVDVILGDWEDAVAMLTLQQEDPAILGVGCMRKVLGRLADDETLKKAEDIQKQIHKLPDVDTVMQTLRRYEEHGDEVSYTAYYLQMADTTWKLYEACQALGHYKPLVNNLSKLMGFDWLWVMPLAE